MSRDYRKCFFCVHTVHPTLPTKPKNGGHIKKPLILKKNIA